MTEDHTPYTATQDAPRSSIMCDERGTTIIEFAVVAPVLIFLIMAIIEVGLIIFAGNIIEAVTNDAARLGITGSNYPGSEGNPDGDVDRETYIRNRITDVAGILLDGQNVSIVCQDLGNGVTNYASNTTQSVGGFTCDEVNNISNETSCDNAGMGGGQSAVIYTVSYCWEYLTPIMGLTGLFGQGFEHDRISISSSMVVLNENFTNGGPGITQ